MKIGALPLFDSKWEIIQFKGKRAQQSHYRIDFHMILCAPLRSFGNVNVYSTKPAVKLFKSVSDQHSWLRNLTPELSRAAKRRRLGRIVRYSAAYAGTTHT